MDSSSLTSQTLPHTLFEARKHVARPMLLAMKVRRSMPSFLDFSSAICPIRCSTCFCLALCGRGMNSSLDRTCVGIGESTPFLRSRWYLRIHIGRFPLAGLFSGNSVHQFGKESRPFGLEEPSALSIQHSAKPLTTDNTDDTD